MSHFATIEVAFEQKNERDLIKALEKFVGEGNVEVHEQPVPLQGMDRGSKAAPPCHIVIRKEKAGERWNDIGFRRTEAGGYTAHMDNIDKFSTKTKDLVAQEYGLLVSERQLKLKGYRVERVPIENGAIRLEGTKF